MPLRGESQDPIKVVYLFTTFPKLTETFLQREVRAMRQLPVNLELFSLWGGDTHFEGLAVRRFSKAKLFLLPFWLPYWMVREPVAFVYLLKGLLRQSVRSWKNLGETFIGVSFAITHAARLGKEGRRPDIIHGVWATMPATAAQMLAKLSGIPFTMGAHAYDIYQNVGDWLLPGKLEDAALIISSTDMARGELLRRGANPEKVVVVRRGLYPFPEFRRPRTLRSPLRILSVARLVQKKGIADQLDIFAEMKRRDIPFEAHIVGDGPLAKTTRAHAEGLGLSENVRLLGKLAFSEVLDQYAWADVFVFTGSVAKDGDRDGLPNVILEAMATGTPVIARKTEGISELLDDGRNGILLSKTEPEQWIDALVRLREDDMYYQRICQLGRVSVEEHNDAQLNARVLLQHFGAVCGR